MARCDQNCVETTSIHSRAIEQCAIKNKVKKVWKLCTIIMHMEYIEHWRMEDIRTNDEIKRKGRIRDFNR